MGASPRKESSPRKKADEGPAIVRTSQLCATFCIHVPMLEVKAPIHSTRKSRYVSATAMRVIAVAAAEPAATGRSACGPPELRWLVGSLATRRKGGAEAGSSTG